MTINERVELTIIKMQIAQIEEMLLELDIPDDRRTHYETYLLTLKKFREVLNEQA